MKLERRISSHCQQLLLLRISSFISFGKGTRTSLIKGFCSSKADNFESNEGRYFRNFTDHSYVTLISTGYCAA